MFAYLGLESATVPAGDVRDPDRTIPRSTIIGISIAALLYVLGTLVVMGVVPHEQLVNSIAPFQDAASIMWGPWAAYVVSLGIIISSIGALNGWTLLMAQVPMAAAQDGLFPPLFGRLSPRGVPAIGIMISAGLATVLLVVQASGSPRFASVYNLIVSLSTMAAVIPYAFCALAGGLIGLRSGKGGPGHRIGAVEIVAFRVFRVHAVRLRRHGRAVRAAAADPGNSGVRLAAAACRRLGQVFFARMIAPTKTDDEGVNDARTDE